MGAPGHRVTAAQLQEHAQRLATDHRSTLGPLHNTELLKRIERGRRWVHEACLDLSVANRLEQSVSPAAEWLLDNEYIIEGNARDVLLNLPRRYYRQLPALASEPDRDSPASTAWRGNWSPTRTCAWTRRTSWRSSRPIKREAPLSIGELWAVPQMLRTALLEGIQQIAGRTQTELRERGIANFWANRLIAANRRDPQPDLLDSWRN